MTAPALTTPQRIISDAMEDAGLLQEGDTPNSEQFAKYMRRLLDVINTLQTQGLKLWTQTDQSVTLVAGTRDYTMKLGGSVNITRPMRVLQGYYLDSDSVLRPIYPLSWDEWLRLSTTTQQGAISQFFVQKQVSQLLVSFWLTPDTTAATGTAHLLIQQQVTNFTGLYDTIDFPMEWMMTLRWCLAADISTGQPQAIMDRCEGKANMYRKMLEDWDVEDTSTRFAPDSQSRGGYSGRSFV